jgi:hypothetical protein
VKSIDLLDNEYVRKVVVVLGASERKYMEYMSNSNSHFVSDMEMATDAQKPFALYIVKEVEIWDIESDRVSRDRNVRNIVPGDHIGGVVVYNEEKDRWEYDTLTIG